MLVCKFIPLNLGMAGYLFNVYVKVASSTLQSMDSGMDLIEDVVQWLGTVVL
jgi:hypothetical protein